MGWQGRRERGTGRSRTKKSRVCFLSACLCPLPFADHTDRRRKLSAGVNCWLLVLLRSARTSQGTRQRFGCTECSHCAATSLSWDTVVILTSMLQQFSASVSENWTYVLNRAVGRTLMNGRAISQPRHGETTSGKAHTTYLVQPSHRPPSAHQAERRQTQSKKMFRQRSFTLPVFIHGLKTRVGSWRSPCKSRRVATGDANETGVLRMEPREVALSRIPVATKTDGAWDHAGPKGSNLHARQWCPELSAEVPFLFRSPQSNQGLLTVWWLSAFSLEDERRICEITTAFVHGRPIETLQTGYCTL